MIYANPQCGRCGRKFPHPVDRVLPIVAYCPRCAAHIDATIQRALYRKTGHVQGGFNADHGYTPPGGN